MVTVKNGVAVILDPVAEVNVPASSGQRPVDGQVPVSEYTIIVELPLQYFLAIDDEPFVLFPEELFVGLPCSGPASPAQKVRQTYPPCGVQRAEHPLAEFVPEYFFDEFIAVVTGTQAISVSDKELLSIEFERFWFMVHGDIQFFFKITIHPHVVVPGKKMNGNTCVGKPCELPQQTDVAFRHNCFVFVPEIEDIANNEEYSRFRHDLFQEMDNPVFSFPALRVVGRAQVEIGEEVNLFSRWKDHGGKFKITTHVGLQEIHTLPSDHAPLPPVFSQYRRYGWVRWRT